MHADVHKQFETTALTYRTALHDAVEHGEIELVKVLIDAGADITVIDPEGNTPLLLARKTGNDDIANLIRARAH